MRRVIAGLAVSLLLLPAGRAVGEVPARVPDEAVPGAMGDGFEGSAEAPKGNPEEYRLGPEDQVRISVWDNKELTQDVVVRPDGKISLPLLQDVQAEGSTAPELAAELSRRFSSYIREPQVSVILLQVNAPKVYVIGSVARPGTYPLRGSMTVLQALSLAGGMTTFADASGIRVVRPGPDGTQKVRKISFRQMIDTEGKGNYLLRPGDTIVVP